MRRQRYRLRQATTFVIFTQAFRVFLISQPARLPKKAFTRRRAGRKFFNSKISVVCIPIDIFYFSLQV
jgi:hypothetical protein